MIPRIGESKYDKHSNTDGATTFEQCLLNQINELRFIRGFLSEIHCYSL